ncbi:hypothetical protein C1646_772938 [Rhizophagus diaphanus]|nr:hypothetical protein C1646_772938 [Rhizophagus diaphanus] [Rhizophagus sp. MUCL 43196]
MESTQTSWNNEKKESEFRPEQFVFIDEISKDERSLSRAYGYGLKNMKAEKYVVFVRETLVEKGIFSLSKIWLIFN